MTATSLVRPRTLRLLEGASLSPAALGLSLTAAYLVLYVAFYAAIGRLPEAVIGPFAFWERPGWWIELVNAALYGYIAAMMLYGLRAALRDLEDLRPALRCSDAEFASVCCDFALFDTRRLLAVTLFFVAGSVAVPFIDEGIWGAERPPLSDPVLHWVLARHVLLGWLLGQAIGMDFALTRRFSRIGAELVRVDLFDQRPLAPFTRRGLRTVLLYAIGIAIFSLFWLQPSRASVANPWLVVVLVGVATAALILPVRGLHQTLREAKRRELAWVRAAVRAELAALRDGAHAEASARLPALLAAEARIQAVREWPFDLSTLLRFLLYLAVGLASWIGAALVERLLGIALG